VFISLDFTYQKTLWLSKTNICCYDNDIRLLRKTGRHVAGISGFVVVIAIGTLENQILQETNARLCYA
jgi:hypothetical protein